jgi:cell division protein FtsB
VQKEFNQVITDKNEEISRLKDHSQKLLAQIKKSKDTKQCIQKLEQENQDLGRKKLSKKEEESSCLKNHNQNLFTQIKKLKNDKRSSKNKLEQLIEKEASKS